MRQLKSIEEIVPRRKYTTGEMLYLFKQIELPSTYPWFYKMLDEGYIPEDYFIRPNPNGYRYIYGSKLRDLIQKLTKGGE